MDPELSWEAHISSIINRCFGILIGLMHARHIIPLAVLPRIVDALVLSHVRYCASVYGSASRTNIAKIQRVFNFSARVISGRRKYDHISDVIDDLAWLSAPDYISNWSLFDAWHPLFRKAWFVAVLAFIQSWARMPRHETIPSASLTTCQEQSWKAALCVPSRWIIQPNGDHQRSLQLDYARVQGQNAGCFACPTRIVYISLASGTVSVSVFLCHRFYHALVFLSVFFFNMYWRWS